MRLELFGLRFEASSLAHIRERRALPAPRSFKKPEEEASSEFWDAFQYGGTLRAQCRCGRTHFCSNTTLDYEEGELEELIGQSVTEPDKYICDTMDDSVAVLDGPNGLLVWGCPCHGAKPFENLLLDYRSQIVDFYRRLIKRDKVRITEESTSLTELESVL